MRIGIDIRSLLEPYPSGISVYTRAITRSLLGVASQDDFVLFTNAATPLPERIRTLFPSDRVQFVETHWPNKFFNMSEAWLGYPPLDRLVGGVDVFFFPNLMFGAVSLQSRLVITAHDLSFQYPGFYHGKSRLWHRVVRPERLYHRADQIIAVSESTKRDLITQFGIAADRITVVYHGIDTEPYEQIDEQSVERFRDTHQLTHPYVLFIGTVSERKNVESVLTVWSDLRRQRVISHDLVIAGHTHDHRLEQQYPGVHFLGYVPDEWKPALYRGANLVVYPSFHEGFGLPVLEAFAASTPVVASHGTAVAEIADTAALTVDPYNQAELAVVIRAALRDQNLRRILVERGRRRVRAFTWKQAAEHTYQILTTPRV